MEEEGQELKRDEFKNEEKVNQRLKTARKIEGLVPNFRRNRELKMFKVI